MSGLGIFLRILNGLLMIGIPCLAGFYLVRRGEGGFRPVGIGVAGFILSFWEFQLVCQLVYLRS